MRVFEVTVSSAARIAQPDGDIAKCQRRRRRIAGTTGTRLGDDDALCVEPDHGYLRSRSRYRPDDGPRYRESSTDRKHHDQRRRLVGQHKRLSSNRAAGIAGHGHEQVSISVRLRAFIPQLTPVWPPPARLTRAMVRASLSDIDQGRSARLRPPQGVKRCRPGEMRFAK